MQPYIAASLLAVGFALAGPAPYTARQQQTLEDRLRTANDELFHKGNVDLVAEIFSPNYVTHLPGGETQMGPQAIREFVTAIRAAFPDLHVEIQVLVENGDRVAWLRTHRGTFESDFLGMRATGNVITWQEMIVTRYEDGMIAEEWGVSDFVEAVQRAQ